MGIFLTKKKKVKLGHGSEGKVKIMGTQMNKGDMSS